MITTYIRRALTAGAAVGMLSGCGSGGVSPLGSASAPNTSAVGRAVNGPTELPAALLVKPDGKGLRKTILTVKFRGKPQFGKEARIIFHNDLNEEVLKKGKTNRQGQAEFWFPPNRLVCAAGFLNNDIKKGICAQPFPKEYTFNFN